MTEEREEKIWVVIYARIKLIKLGTCLKFYSDSEVVLCDCPGSQNSTGG